MSAQLTLTGLRVVVTRPRKQATQIVELLAAHGADVVALPALDIEPVTPGDALAQPIDNVQAAIAVSANAVHYGLPWLRLHEPNVALWPWFAVGPGTAAALKQYEIDAGVPSKHDTQGLMSLPPVRNLRAGDSALLLRGEGGRKLLADRLRQRDVSVFELPVYRRVMPPVDVAVVDEIVGGPQPVALLVSSQDAFDNLRLMFDRHLPWLFGKALLATVSERVAAHAAGVAAGLGYAHLGRRLWQMPGATADATLAGLRQNWSRWQGMP